jgi:hypothetical protein
MVPASSSEQRNVFYILINILVFIPFSCFGPLGLLPFLGMAVDRPVTRSSASNFMARKNEY